MKRDIDPTDNIQEVGGVVMHESAGGYLFFDNDTTLYIALTKRKDSGYYLPKGHIKHGEKALNAAVREIKEELGIEHDFEMISEAGTAEFGFKLPDDPREHKKKVYLYVFKINKMVSLIGEGGEYDDPSWLSVQEARKLLVFDRPSFDRAVKLFKASKTSQPNLGYVREK